MVTDANGTHEAKLPSGDLKIVGNIVVAANETAAVTFDFMADESLHLTGKGEYIMAPVIQFKSRSDAEVEIEADGRARISGGENEADEKVGMDVSGKVGVGLQIAGDEDLAIEGGAIKLGTSATGRAVFTATDAAANLSSVSSVKITVNSIQAHSAKGWKTVSAEEKTYDLLELKASGDKVVLADVQLSEGTYEQIRLNISKVMVKDENGTHEAKLPSGELKVVGRLSVDANKTSAVIFDFIVNESLHLTGDGQYVFAPVVRFQTFKNASVELKSGGKAEINGGKLEADEKVGMDLDGKVGAGRGIRADEDLEIEASGRIKATA
jgi:hypothetical protein